MIPQTRWTKLTSENLRSKMERLQPSSMISKIVRKLRDLEYRKAFVASQINIGIPFQIRALMKARGWTQEKLAERTGMLQPRISAILRPGKVRPNIETLRRIAEAFDCGLLVRFVSFSELAKWSDSFEPEKFNVPAFDDDPGFKEPEQEPEPTAVATMPKYLAGGTLYITASDSTAVGDTVAVTRQENIGTTPLGEYRGIHLVPKPEQQVAEAPNPPKKVSAQTSKRLGKPA